MSAEKYSYTNTWRLSRKITASPESVMSAMQENPSQVFPFPIRYPQGALRTIEKGTEYLLRAAYLRKDPVMVDSVEDTSFRFVSLPGHWHGPDATIEFTVFRGDDGRMRLSQHAEFTKKWYTPAADIASKVIWFAQARRLSHLAKKLPK